MDTPKDQAISAISLAQAELAKALSHLEALPVFDPSNVLVSAHALNNYLSVVAGIADLLKVKIPLESDEVVTNLLSHLEHTTHIMRQTVKRLAHMSMDRADSFLSTRVDLVRLVQFVKAQYQKAANIKRIEIQPVQIPAEALVLGDAVALAAVMDNLISNALKYSAFDKNVYVSVVRDDGKDMWICSVRDEGPGIAEKDLDALFKQGRRLGHTPTGGEPSTGYGLAVAKELVETMGGTVWCVSQVNVGSTFSFSVPIYQGSDGTAD